jgi:hypothetical protein
MASLSNSVHISGFDFEYLDELENH